MSAPHGQSIPAHGQSPDYEPEYYLALHWHADLQCGRFSSLDVELTMPSGGSPIANLTILSEGFRRHSKTGADETQLACTLESVTALRNALTELLERGAVVNKALAERGLSA